MSAYTTIVYWKISMLYALNVHTDIPAWPALRFSHSPPVHEGKILGIPCALSCIYIVWAKEQRRKRRFTVSELLLQGGSFLPIFFMRSVEARSWFEPKNNSVSKIFLIHEIVDVSFHNPKSILRIWISICFIYM